MIKIVYINNGKSRHAYKQAALLCLYGKISQGKINYKTKEISMWDMEDRAYINAILRGVCPGCEKENDGFCNDECREDFYRIIDEIRDSYS